MTTVRCVAETRHGGRSMWHTLVVRYRTTNTKRALATAMRAIEKRWPGAHRYEADIVEGMALAELYTCADCDYSGYGAWNCELCGQHNLARYY